MTLTERNYLSDLVVEKTYKPGSLMAVQGNIGNEMFIVEQGECICRVGQGNRELEVMRYKRGQYFGELYLIFYFMERRASVYASENGCTVLSISTIDFNR